MKKKYWAALILISMLVTSVLVLNKTVTTSQGVNYKVSVFELPLYLKIINFYDRHFNLKWLTNRVTHSSKTSEAKIIQLFEWTHNTINAQPESLPVMDDHVWNVYVRRYGISENFHDLFTTLCNYIGVDSFFYSIYSDENSKKMNFSLVKIDRGWAVFDPYHGVYFKTIEGDWATIDDLKNKKWKLARIASSTISESEYEPFLDKLPDIKNIELKRASIQSPINRLKYQIKKWLSGEKALLE